MPSPDDNSNLAQPGQLDFFTNSQGQDSDTLEGALNWIAQEREKSIGQWASFLDEFDQELMKSGDDLKIILHLILWDQDQFAGKLKAVLDIYIREQRPDKPVVDKYSKAVLPTFNLLPGHNIQHYLRKTNIAEDAGQAIASDWSKVFGDLYFAFRMESQRDSG